MPVRRRGLLAACGSLPLWLALTIAVASTAPGLATRPVGSAPAVAVHGGAAPGQTARTPTDPTGRLTDEVLGASAARPPSVAPWTPEAPVYAVFTAVNIPIKMADGVILRANLLYPADPATGVPAPGPFPVLLAQTPYGKTLAGPNPYLVQRGYIEAIVDVRGTGASRGQWGLLDPEQIRDAVSLVHWAAQVPHATGRVGLFGASYLGINQLLTAAAVGPNSPLKAIFPMVAATDVYRDAAVMGGLPDSEFFDFYLGFTAGLNTANPVKEGTAAGVDQNTPGEVAAVEADHLHGLGAFHAGYLADGNLRFDSPYWGARRPSELLGAIVANNIPAYLVGGWHDLFQRGEPLNYTGLQNAVAGRPVGAPMAPGQRVTGRYQLLMGPWYHLTFGQGVDLDKLQLEWFDTWLRGEPTGMDQTPTPLHLFDLGTHHYLDTDDWPLQRTTPQRLYLGAGRSGTANSLNDGTLSPAAPRADGADGVAFGGVSSPCGKSTDQWSQGLSTVLFGAAAPLAAPCDGDDRTLQSTPSALTYTSAPFSRPGTLGGPIGVTLFATSTTTDSEWVVTVEDVGPDGTSLPLTEGALVGSMRALDVGRSWWVPDGGLLLPFHVSTQASASLVPAGQLARYDVEVFPTLASIGAGHRLRITISTSDTPHLLPTAEQLADLAGGVYQVMRSPGAASFVTLPIVTGGMP
jgi:putative CocE/NonD family hydrolase